MKPDFSSHCMRILIFAERFLRTTFCFRNMELKISNFRATVFNFYNLSKRKLHSVSKIQDRNPFTAIEYKRYFVIWTRMLFWTSMFSRRKRMTFQFSQPHQFRSFCSPCRELNCARIFKNITTVFKKDLFQSCKANFLLMFLVVRIITDSGF